MKIDSKIATYEIAMHLPNATPAIANEKQSSKGVKTEQNGAQDTIVHLSRASKEVQLAGSIISKTPEIREDKVAEIRDRLESGNYEIDHEKIAAKLIDSHLEEIL